MLNWLNSILYYHHNFDESDIKLFIKYWSIIKASIIKQHSTDLIDNVMFFVDMVLRKIILRSIILFNSGLQDRMKLAYFYVYISNLTELKLILSLEQDCSFVTQELCLNIPFKLD